MSEREGAPGSVSTARALVCLGVGAGLVAVAGRLAVLGVEPVATWLYPCAWYPLLLAFEGGVALRHGRFLLLGRPRALASVLAWSVPLWMLWELLNFRVENWYYVFVPEGRVALWTGVVTSFATVLPACFVPSALLHPSRPRRARHGPVEARVPARVRGAMAAAGALMLILPLLGPRVFFPLIWGGFFFLAEAETSGRAPGRSLVVDARSGRWARTVSLLAGGAVAGLAWEALNVLARGRWIYTVPWLEQLKLFEMPPLGFLGFPPLALSCFALYQLLVSRGWAPPVDPSDAAAGRAPGAVSGDPVPRGRTGDPAPGPGERGPEGDGPAGRGGAGRVAEAAAVLLVISTLLGMERWTISSRTPRLRDLPGMLPSRVEDLRAWGVTSPFDLAGRAPRELARTVPGVETGEAERWIATARLATTRGIGARNARLLHRWGVEDLDGLAAADTAALARCFRRSGADTGVRPAQVRVWWRAARRRVEGEPPSSPALDC